MRVATKRGTTLFNKVEISQLKSPVNSQVLRIYFIKFRRPTIDCIMASRKGHSIGNCPVQLQFRLFSEPHPDKSFCFTELLQSARREERTDYKELDGLGLKPK